MSFVQYVPKDDKKLQQMLTSSAFAWFIFSVIEEETINLIQKTIGQVEYNYTDESRSGDKSTYSKKEAKKDLITNDILNSLASEFAHLVYIPNDKILYKGYTPQAYVPSRNEKFIKRDLTPFYQIKYSGDNEEIIDVEKVSFEELFKKKKMSKLEKYKLYKKYEQAKKEGKEEEFKKEELPELGKKKVDFDLLFKDFIRNDQVISNKMKLYTVEERMQMWTEWNKLEGDVAAQLEFLEKNDLFGAVPGIFDFDKKTDAQKDIRIKDAIDFD